MKRKTEEYIPDVAANHVRVDPFLIEIERKGLLKSSTATVKYNGHEVGEIVQINGKWYREDQRGPGFDKPMYPADLLIRQLMKDLGVQL